MGVITIDEIIKLVFPIIALIISILALYYNYTNGRRQVKISKIEELIQILNNLNFTYPALLSSYKELQRREESKIDEVVFGINNSVFKRNKEFFIAVIESKESYLHNLSRAEILTKCYVTNRKVSMKIMGYIDHISAMTLMVLEQMPIEQSTVRFKPKYKQLKSFVEKLEGELIIEMNLKSNTPTSIELEKYYKEEFPKIFKDGR